MKGQPLSYDRISWPQQPERGWQSSDSGCMYVCVCVCVCACVFLCVFFGGVNVHFSE